MDKIKTKMGVPADSMIAAEGIYIDRNKANHQNENMVIVGTTGSGKTHNGVEPNIIQASGSYVISDPKGNLYGKYKKYLASKGYEVLKLDFTNPKKSTRYNFLNATVVEGDDEATNINIMKLCHSLVDTYMIQNGGTSRRGDPFWDNAAELLLCAIVGYIVQYSEPKYHNFTNVNALINALSIQENDSDAKAPLDYIFEQLEEHDPNSIALRNYKSFRVAAGRTLKSIQISANVIIKNLCNDEIDYFMSADELDVESIGKRKTALFICSSDTDRTYDCLVDLVFTQIITKLMRYADSRKNSKLEVPVKIIMDDFATNVRVADFPRLISCFRSRGISSMILLQAESQLEKYYGCDASTIIQNCDTYVYMGGNDIDTAYSVSLRANKTLNTILEMSPGKAWVFRRGCKPIFANLFDINKFKEEKGLTIEYSR